jgi:DNA-binding NarL/FixJ family response regulator
MISVLLVDDHPVMRRLLLEVLEYYDDLSIVGEAGNGEDAIIQASHLQPSVAIVDINLPTMSGIQTAESIKFHSPSTAIIGLTAGDQDHKGKAMIAAGAVAVLDKAAVLESLYPSILEAISRVKSPL